MGLTNFILECEKDNEQLRNDINYCKNFNKRLQKENQELKKQLEYLRGREYLNQLRFERDMLKNVVDNGEVSKEDKQFIDMTHRNTELLEQQKEFIEYMNKTIEELECEDVDDEEMKGYLIQRTDTFKEILSKYKEIIGRMMKIKVLELFGGIGACSKALERLGIDYEIVDYVEIDKYAVKSFNAIHNTNFEPQDITTWDKDIKVDLIMHGSPCQDFSLAGKQAGGDKDSGTRSSLMYETIRIVEKLKPKYVIWENVKNLLSKKHKHNFDAYLETMEKLGYTNYYQVLNAKDYGIPQNRERVFTISIRNDLNKTFVFPPKQELKLKLKDMLEDEVDEKYIISDKLMIYYDRKIKQGWRKELHLDNKEISSTICNPARNNINDTFVKVIGGVGEKKSNGGTQWYQQDRIYDNNIGLSLSTTAQPYYPDNQLRIRKLTPKECWRLMGFDDEDFEKASQVNSNSQLYKQAGNSIVVNVLENILKNLINFDKGE